MGNMPMAGMQGIVMRSDSMLSMMRAHLDSLGTASPQAAAGAMSAHDAMMSQMLDAMGADMSGMGMKADPAWTALTDSVKRDLADLSGLTGGALETRLKGHISRVRRLLAMHETMMHASARSPKAP
jgi:hypothetical protein